MFSTPCCWKWNQKQSPSSFRLELMHSLPRNGMNRGECALNLAASLTFSLLFLQWAETMKVKRLFAEKERRRERGREGRGHSECEPQQDLELCWGSPGHGWYQLGLTHLYWGKRSIQFCSACIPLKWRSCGKVRESIWNESAVNPQLPWKRKEQISGHQTVVRQRLKMVS